MRPNRLASGTRAAAKFDAVPVRAALVAWLRRVPLPPGDRNRPLDAIEIADRLALLRLAEETGAIFKGRAWGGFWIYVVGLPVCRTILRRHEDDLRPVTIDVGTMFDKGLLRQMEGPDHRQYRTPLVQAIKAMPGDPAVGDVAGIATAFADPTPTGMPLPVPEYQALLARIAFDELVRVVFGIVPNSPAYDRLAAAYGNLGGHGLVWNPGPRQARAYAAIAAILRDHMSANGSAPRSASSLIGHLADQGTVDAVMLGNLIYMVEMGRYDLAAFFRWLTWFAAAHPAWMDRMAGDDDGQRTVAAAFVSEALRMEQSERLVRHVKRDFVAEGFLFPKGARVRFCIWESHKSADAHADPFSFNPDRFLGKRPGPDQYSPFGIDRHQCPFGAYTIRLGSAFLTALAQRYQVSTAECGAAVRGLYHWEPAEGFAPILTPRRPGFPGGRPAL